MLDYSDSTIGIVDLGHLPMPESMITHAKQLSWLEGLYGG
jgi:hypothetical protein